MKYCVDAANFMLFKLLALSMKGVQIHNKIYFHYCKRRYKNKNKMGIEFIYRQ